MYAQPYDPATAQKLYGILSMPDGNQYAKYNGELLEVETLLAAGAASLILEKGVKLNRSASFILDREFRLVNSDGNDVSLEAAFGGNFAHGQQVTAAPPTVVCPTCDGSGTNAHELPSRERFVHGGEIHECYTCEGSGRVPGEAAPAPVAEFPEDEDAMREASTAAAPAPVSTTPASYYQIQKQTAEGEVADVYDAMFDATDHNDATSQVLKIAAELRKSGGQLTGRARYKLHDPGAEWNYITV